MSKAITHRWAAYTRNQEAVAAAIARKEYVDLTPTGVGVVDNFFALMDEVGIMKRLEVEGVYQRRLMPIILLIVTYCAKIIMVLTPDRVGGSYPRTSSGMQGCCGASVTLPSK